MPNDLYSLWTGLEQPIIFFDSKPGSGPGFVRASLNRFGRHLSTAWTGVAYKEVESGYLRLLWYTTDGVRGMRDYELRQATSVKEAFEELFNLPEVAHAVVLGYASQNPYTMYQDGSVDEKGNPRPKDALADGPQNWIKTRKTNARGVEEVETNGTIFNNINEIIDAADKEPPKVVYKDTEEV